MTRGVLRRSYAKNPQESDTDPQHIAGTEHELELASEVRRQEVLDMLPQKGSFRFIDKIEVLTTSRIVATYYFTGKEWFYSGHFPGDPVTPGVILVEAMAQAALVALGLYIVSKEEPNIKLKTLFSECVIEFLAVVPPKTRVVIKGERIYWRRRKLRSKVELTFEDGTLAAAGTVSGLGVIVQ